MENESIRQQKVAEQIRRDMSEIFRAEGRDLFRGVMATVTAVKTSPDLTYAKIYVSVFPFAQSGGVMLALEKENWMLRRALGQRLRNLKSVPEITFFLDDSLEYVEKIDRAMQK